MQEKEKYSKICRCGRRIYEGDKVFWASRYKNQTCVPTCSKECFEKFKQYQITRLKEKLEEIETQICEEDIF